MADFSLEDLKALRERLGTGMVETKNALVEAGGDLEKATELLRLRGAKSNAKRLDRSTSEGLIAAQETPGATYIIELSCETDFVAKGEKYHLPAAAWQSSRGHPCEAAGQLRAGMRPRRASLARGFA